MIFIMEAIPNKLIYRYFDKYIKGSAIIIRKDKSDIDINIHKIWIK